MQHSWKCAYCGGQKGLGTNHSYCSQQLQKRALNQKKPANKKMSKKRIDYLTKLGNQ